MMFYIIKCASDDRARRDEIKDEVKRELDTKGELLEAVFQRTFIFFVIMLYYKDSITKVIMICSLILCVPSLMWLTAWKVSLRILSISSNISKCIFMFVSVQN